MDPSSEKKKQIGLVGKDYRNIEAKKSNLLEPTPFFRLMLAVLLLGLMVVENWPALPSDVRK